MRYSLTLLETQYEALYQELFDGATTERAAYLVCQRSVTEYETRFLVRDVMFLGADEIVSATPVGMAIKSSSYVRAMKEVDRNNGSFVFVHSHPEVAPTHSPQDDREEPPLFRAAFNRIHNVGPHASLVISGPFRISGRVWLEDGSVAVLERIRIIGRRFRFIDAGVADDPVPAYFDRQVRAFGPENQRLMNRLRVGVVGAGGTGSAVVQQLTRLGVGQLLVSDGEAFEDTNVNRVYASRLNDHDHPKVEIVARTVNDIGLGTVLETIDKPITFQSVLKRFRDCDIVFCCTDNQWSRSLLTRLAIYYAIPVFDMAAEIDSHDGVIRAVEGRVTTLIPGAACLFCRSRIQPSHVAAEADRVTNPERAAALRVEGYAPELEDPAPAVIPFTTAVAASSVNELLHRLTGYLGDERASTEIIHRFSDSRLSTNTRAPKTDCFCADARATNRGDAPLFLNTTWRDE